MLNTHNSLPKVQAASNDDNELEAATSSCAPESSAERRTNAPSSPRVKSFSRRVGRKLTTSRKSDLSNYLPKISVKLEPDIIVEPRDLFERNMDFIELEVGFGTGEHLVNRALDNSNFGYIGCEPYLNGVAKITQLAKQTAIQNLRIYADDALHVIDALAASSIDRILVLFPDPWPKKRHHIRRIINLSFLDKICRILKDKGKLIIATDHAEYAAWIEKEIYSYGKFKLVNLDNKKFPDKWHKSKYHLKAESQGLTPFFFEFDLI